MFDLKTLSRPMRRVLAEWLGKLVNRLIHFRDQLRYGIVRMISSTIAETIEDQFDRSNPNPARRHVYDEEDDEYYYEPGTYGQPSSVIADRSPQGRPSPYSQGSWYDIFAHGTSILMRWVRGPWAEPILASVVTMISLLLVVR